MRTPEQQAAFEAVKRLDTGLLVAAQIAVLQCAVRALIQASPNQEQVRKHFDQLLGNYQTYPSTMSADQSLVLRDLVEQVFQPPASPDTLLPQD